MSRRRRNLRKLSKADTLESLFFSSSKRKLEHYPTFCNFLVSKIATVLLPKTASRLHWFPCIDTNEEKFPCAISWIRENRGTNIREVFYFSTPGYLEGDQCWSVLSDKTIIRGEVVDRNEVEVTFGIQSDQMTKALQKVLKMPVPKELLLTIGKKR
jgi:hypothetical protein